jgi:hypothetical protein
MSGFPKIHNSGYVGEKNDKALSVLVNSILWETWGIHKCLLFFKLCVHICAYSVEIIINRILMKSIFCVCVVLGKEPRILHKLGKCSPSDLHPQPFILFLLLIRSVAIPSYTSSSFKKKFWVWQSGLSSRSACLENMKPWVQTPVSPKKSVFTLTSTDITIWHTVYLYKKYTHAFLYYHREKKRTWTSDNSEYRCWPEFVVYKIQRSNWVIFTFIQNTMFTAFWHICFHAESPRSPSFLLCYFLWVL